MTFSMFKKEGSLCFEVRKRGVVIVSITLFFEFESRKKLTEKSEEQNLF